MLYLNFLYDIVIPGNYMLLSCLTEYMSGLIYPKCYATQQLFLGLKVNKCNCILLSDLVTTVLL